MCRNTTLVNKNYTPVILFRTNCGIARYYFINVFVQLENDKNVKATHTTTCRSDDYNNIIFSLNNNNIIPCFTTFEADIKDIKKKKNHHRYVKRTRRPYANIL